MKDGEKLKGGRGERREWKRGLKEERRDEEENLERKETLKRRIKRGKKS